MIRCNKCGKILAKKNEERGFCNECNSQKADKILAIVLGALFAITMVILFAT